MSSEITTNEELDVLKKDVSNAYNYYALQRAYENDITQSKKEISKVRDYYAYVSRKCKRTKIIFGILLFYAAMFSIFFTAECAVSNTLMDNLALIIVSIIILIGLIITAIIMIKKANSNKSHYFRERLKPTISEQEQNIKNAQEEKENAKSRYAVFLDIMPPNYKDVYAVSFVYTSIMNCRAETLKEALNLYEEAMHRMRMERNLQKIQQIQEDILYEAQQIKERLTDIYIEI